MNNNNFSDLLEKMNINLTDKQYEQFDKYFEILVEWNSFMNLTGITEYDEVLLKHFADSIIIKKAIEEIGYESKSKNDVSHSIDFSKDISIIDVGTGAGFPGLPIKIAFPDTKVTLMDSLNKRVKFLNEVITQLGLTNIEAIHSRAEECGHKDEFREKYDLSVSRAVANLSTLVEYCFAFVKVGGYFIAYKSGDVDEEVTEAKKAISLMGGTVENVYKFRLPDSDIDRSFIVVKKIKNTPKKFPRKAGLPSKEPIK